MKTPPVLRRYKRGWPCRCSRKACQARKTLRLHPDGYWGANARHARCGCGAALRVDRTRAEGRDGQVCQCMGYPFQHRRGSTFCHEGGAGADAGFGYPACEEFSAWNLAGRPETGYRAPVGSYEYVPIDLAHVAEDCPL